MGTKLDGQVAIVTGAARGIGLVIARHLAAEGARLVIADIDADTLAEAASSLSADQGRGVALLAGDLSREDVAKALVDKAIAQFGRLDILVNNAGGGIIRPFLDHTPDTLRTESAPILMMRP